MKPTIATDDRPGALYTVAIPHFLLLYVLTGGCYLFYWSYRNWASYKAHTGAAITPVVRGLLWPFLFWSCSTKCKTLWTERSNLIAGTPKAGHY